MENLNTTPLPRIGDKAPSFEAVTTQGPIRFPEDYAGRWIILFSHPSDFTPVCTSEFMTFAARSDEFEALNCQLVGLSVDGLYSHIAWLRTIRDKIVYRGMQHVEVRFPLIADLRMKVANLYGMIQPGESSTSAVRAVFFIDPDATIRAVIYYPLALGRNSTRSNACSSACKPSTASTWRCPPTGIRATKRSYPPPHRRPLPKSA